MAFSINKQNENNQTLEINFRRAYDYGKNQKKKRQIIMNKNE